MLGPHIDMKRILHSFSLIINYKTFIVTALSLISTYLCYEFGLTAKFPDMLVGVASLKNKQEQLSLQKNKGIGCD